jgi:hypothetical protein
MVHTSVAETLSAHQMSPARSFQVQLVGAELLPTFLENHPNRIK